MPINILMPALSPTMEKGSLAKWLKKEGDRVAPGDVIAEIETDKATMEVEAVDEGVLAKILVPEGTADVPVNQPIAVLAAEGEDVKKAAAAAAPKATPQARAPEAVKAAPIPAPSPSPPRAGEGAPARAERAVAAPMQAQAPAASARTAVTSLAAGAQAGGIVRVGARDVASAAVQSGRGDRIFASPLARRLAREAGIEITQVMGSGPNGRVIARDIAAAREGKALRAPAAPAAPAAPPAVAPAPTRVPSDEAIRALFEEGSYELVAHDNVRKVIARRLVEAKQTIPHFYLTIDCAIDRLLAARAEINAAAPRDKDGNPVYKLSVNDFVIKALALALQKVPEANVTWTEGGMLKHKYSDVAVAVAIPGGLITPVVRRAEAKSLSVISAEMKDFAARARVRKLKPEEYQGGSSAVSNLGMYGIRDFAAVINPPHATILAVGAGEERAVVRGGKIEVSTIMTCTLSTDHRAVDGALGATLLGAFKALIENPVLMVV